MVLNIKDAELQTVKTILKSIIPNHQVLAFGSRVNGDSRPSSDLDLLIIGRTNLDKNQELALKLAFSDSNLPYFVDLVDNANINEEFRNIITQQTITIQNQN